MTIDFKNLNRINLLQSVYLRLPITLQNLLVTIEGKRLSKRRYGKGYKKIYDVVVNRYKLNKESLLRYQENRLKGFLKTASESEYWGNKFSKFKFNINADNIFYEIKKLPLLSKDEVKENIRKIRPRLTLNKKLLLKHTGGTTGSGLNFWELPEAEKEACATWWRYRSWYGISLEDRCGFFSGRVRIASMKQMRPPFWRISKMSNQFFFSTHHLTAETAHYYIEAMRKYKLKWLVGAPSFLSLLASYMFDQNIPIVDSLKVITTGAENLMPHQRNIIKKVFKVPVSQLYSQTESVAIFSECEKEKLHVDEDFSYVEFVPLVGNNSQKCYKVVGTNWANSAFPLIRYDTRDIVLLSSTPCSCGRPGRVIEEMNGREGDYIVLKDRRRISRLNFIFQDLIHIRETQIYQRKYGEIIVKVVKGKLYDKNKEEAKLIKELKKFLGIDIIISIQYVDTIPKTKAGKIKFVVSDLVG